MGDGVEKEGVSNPRKTFHFPPFVLFPPPSNPFILTPSFYFHRSSPPPNTARSTRLPLELEFDKGFF